VLLKGAPAAPAVRQPWTLRSTWPVAVAVDITNPGDSELSLTLGICDVDHRMNYRDRLNLPIEIPVGAVRPCGDGAGEFYLARLWLE